MFKFLKSLAMAAVVASFMPTVEVEAANVVVLPLINNVADFDAGSSIYFDRIIDSIKRNGEHELLDGDNVEKAVAKYTKTGMLPDDNAMKNIAQEIGADVIFAMQIDSLTEDMVYENLEYSLIEKIEGKAVTYNAITGKYKLAKIFDDEKSLLQEGARYNLRNAFFGKHVTREINRAIGNKKLNISGPKISKSGFKGDR